MTKAKSSWTATWSGKRMPGYGKTGQVLQNGVPDSLLTVRENIRAGIPMPDEPTTGLDPQTRRDIWNTVLRPKEDDMTVFLTAHYMEEAEDTGSGCGHQQGEGHSGLYVFRSRRKIQFGYPFDHVEKHGRPTAALEGTP